VDTYGFDGLDIDWEYPVGGGLGSNINRPEDKTNYTLLLQELRSQLDASNPNYRLTIAAPAGPTTIQNMDLPDLAVPLDWINLMTYDFEGSWSPATGFNAPMSAPAGATGNAALANTEGAIQTYLAAGVPPQKIVMGLPFYGRGFAGVGDTNSGLGQPFSGVPSGTWEAGMFDYHDLVTNYISNAAYTRYFDNDTLVPWLHSSSLQVMISYDDAESFGHKLDYIIDNSLGGAMFWELSGDTATRTMNQQLADRLLP
jgi:chitinase